MGLSNNVLLKEDMDDLVGKDSRISSNRLPARVSSFEHMKNEWKKYLSEKAKPAVDMETVVEKAVEVPAEQSMNVPAEQSMNAPVEQSMNAPVEKSTNVSDVEPKKGMVTEKASPFVTQLISKLEEKINVLTVENVPTNLVKSRAIRLRENMYNSLVSNSNGLCSVKLVNDANDIPSVSETVNDNVVDKTVHDKDLIDVQKISDVNKEEIVSDINNAMNDVSDTPLVVEDSGETTDTVNTVPADFAELGTVEPVMPIEFTKSEEKQVEPVVPAETVKIDREPVVIVEERTQTPIVTQEKEEGQLDIPDNVEVVDVPIDAEDKSFSTLGVLKELENAKMLYQKSLDELNDAKQKKAAEEDEAQKAVSERIEALAKLKKMKEKVRIACEEFNQKAEDNRTSAVSILEGIDKMKSFIGDQRVAADDYNAQLEKMAEALNDGVNTANLTDDSSINQNEVVRRM